jgi:hypothetical protein
LFPQTTPALREPGLDNYLNLSKMNAGKESLRRSENDSLLAVFWRCGKSDGIEQRNPAGSHVWRDRLLCGSTPNVGRFAQQEGTAIRDFPAFSPRFDEGDATLGAAPRLLSPLPSAL